jgi:long-chain fatty acid transport protein
MPSTLTGRSVRLWLGFGLLLSFVASTPARAQFGLALGGVGPINRSMGGASTAAPIDSAGSLYWNPASITGLPNNEMEFGVGFFIPRTTLTSSLPAGSIGANTPATNLSGKTGGNNGTFLLPAFGLVYTPNESPWTVGLGVYEMGGFGVNYPVDTRNPVLNPRPPFGFGVGPLYTQLQIIQFAPTVAVKLTDTLSIGAAANIDTGSLMIDPALFSAPGLTQTPLGPAPNYPSATNGRYRVGAGFHVGIYWEPNESWSFGAAYKSQQWFEQYTYNEINLNGQGVSPKFHLDFPMFVTVGAAYKGIDKLLLAADFRFVDYRDISGFRSTGFDQRGALQGLGWQNLFGLALGAQYKLTDDLTVRAGYTFALNPVSGAVTMYNLGSPTIIQHSLALGASYNVTQRFKLSVAWAHDFQNSVEGPIILPFSGPVRGSSVKNTATADSVMVGAAVAF